MKSLTPKQRRFVSEYLRDLNATAAAKRAGYSKKTAYAIGHENLRKPEIAREIKIAQQRILERTETEIEATISHLRDIGQGYVDGSHNSAALAIRAIGMLGRILGMF
jgi:phage terminase small subunit